MALPADFSKIFGSTATGGLTPIGDVNYAKGWEFVGSNPPTKNDFSYLQNQSDLKAQWLYSNKLQRTDPFGDIKSDGTASTAIENLGINGLIIGQNQTWQNVLATRVAGVNYTNSTGKPILVAIATIVNAAVQQSTFFCGGVAVTSVALTGGDTGESVRGSISVIVPNGYTYQLNASAQILQWSELR